MIAVSTTLSASEFTENAGITQSATNTKQSFRHRLFAPRTVVLDPASTLDTPDWLLFCTGIRSVDHAVENYCNAKANLATEALSLQGLKLLHRALPAIKRNPRDLAPRLEAQIGMWQAIAPSAAGVPTGASHGIGYALGATFGVAARAHLLRDAARGAEVERGRQRRAPEGPVGGHGRAGPASAATLSGSWWRASTSPPRCGRSASSARTSTRSRGAR